MIPNYNNGNGQFMNPQYFQNQFDQAMNQYKQLYGQNHPTNNVGFVGQYINSYDEVEKAQVPMNGTPTMFVGNGVFWIKKFVNGQSYISAYKFEAINNVGEPVQQNQQAVEQTTQKQEDSQIDIATILQGMEASLNNINERLVKVEGGINNGLRGKSNSQYDGKQNQTKQSTNG